MGTNYIAPIWRMPRNANKDKLSNYNIDFNPGDSNYIDCGDSDLLSFGDSVTDSPFSISAWINMDSATNFRIVSKYDAPNYEYQFDVGSSNKLQFYIFDGSNYRGVGYDTALNTGEWYHVIATYDGSGSSSGMTLYLNGLAVNDVTFSNGSYTAMHNTTATVKIGRIASSYADGKISQVCIFGYALNSTQVTYLYNLNNPMAISGAEPVAYWPLGDNSNPNANAGYPNISVGADSVFDFDGSNNEYINCGHSSLTAISGGSTTLSTPMTISMWFKLGSSSTSRGLINFGDLNNNYGGFSIRHESNTLSFIRATQHIVTGGYTFTDTTSWHNMILIYDPSNSSNCYLYIDGSDTGVTFNSNVGNIDFLNSNGTQRNLIIGAYYGLSETFTGELSNVAIWGSNEFNEISNIYNSGAPATSYTNTPTAWYKLNQSANWEADTANTWQIPDNRSAYPQSFDFSGGNYIDCGNDSSLSPSNFTLSVWAKSDLSNGSWISKYASENYGFGIYGGSIFLNIKTSAGWSGLSVTASSYLTADKWHHIVGTYDETDLKIYVDGNLAGTLAKAGPITYSSRNTRIGNLEGTSALDFNGQISNAQIFDTALLETGTDSVETLYNNGVPLTTVIASDNLKLWAKLDNTATWTGSSFSVPDASGNGNTGTSSGMTEQNLVNNNVSVFNGESSGMNTTNLVTSNLTRTQPYSNYSFNFDSASSDYFDLGGLQSTALQPSNATLVSDGFSVSVWVNLDDTSTFRTFWQNDGLGNANYYGLILLMNTGGQINMGYNNGGTAGSGSRLNYITTSAQITSTNTWYHIVAIYKGVGSVASPVAQGLYVNGVEITAFNTPTGSASSLAYSTSAKGSIGIGRNAIQPMEGKISNCACFDRTLTQDEVLNIYNNGVPQDLQTTSTFSNNLVAWWPMDGSNSYYDGTNWVVRDIENAKDGTGVNTGNIDDLVGNAPGSEASGTGTNLTITDLIGNMSNSDKNAYSINMADYASGVTNPANSGRSTDTP